MTLYNSLKSSGRNLVLVTGLASMLVFSGCGKNTPVTTSAEASEIKYEFSRFGVVYPTGCESINGGTALTSGDFDGDGDLDLAGVCTYNTDYLVLFENKIPQKNQQKGNSPLPSK